MGTSAALFMDSHHMCLTATGHLPIIESMMHAKKSVFLLLFLMIIPILVQAQYAVHELNRSTLLLGYYTAKPSCWTNAEGHPEGVFIDIFKLIAEEIGVKPDFSLRDWSDLLEGLKRGTIPVVPAIVKTDERSQYAWFTTEPVMFDWGAIFTNRDSSIRTMIDLSGKRVGVLKDDFWYSGAGALRDVAVSFGVVPHYIEFDDYDSLFLALSMGQIEAAVGSNSLGLTYEPVYSIEPSPIIFKPVDLRFAVSKALPDGELLISQIDDAIHTLKAEKPRVIQDILSRYAVPDRREFIFPEWASSALSIAFAVSVLLLILSLYLSSRNIKARKEMQEVREELSFAMKAANIALWKWELKTQLLTFSDELRELLVMPEQPLSRPYREWMDFITNPKIRLSLEKELAEGIWNSNKGLTFDFPFEIKGAKHWFRIIGQVLERNSEGKVSRVSGSLQDVTEDHTNRENLVAAFAERENLLHEVHHRVKNNLQLILSLLDLQTETASQESNHDRHTQSIERIRSIAFVEQAMYDAGSLTLEGLSRFMSLLSSNLMYHLKIKKDPLVVATSIESISIPAGKAIPLALILNELITNACQYGLPYEDSRISVKITKRSENIIQLKVKDSGPGFPPDFNPAQTETMGYLIIHNLVKQLDGKMETRNLEGALVTIDIPI